MQTIIDQLSGMRATLASEYWQLHKELGTTQYDSQREQMRAAVRLGKIAEAIESLSDAQTKLSDLN